MLHDKLFLISTLYIQSNSGAGCEPPADIQTVIFLFMKPPAGYILWSGFSTSQAAQKYFVDDVTQKVNESCLVCWQCHEFLPRREWMSCNQLILCGITGYGKSGYFLHPLWTVSTKLHHPPQMYFWSQTKVKTCISVLGNQMSGTVQVRNTALPSHLWWWH